MTKQVAIQCPKCDGQGRIEGFAHIEAGKCYLCFGAGTIRCLPVAELAKKRTQIRWLFIGVEEHIDEVGSANAAWVTSRAVLCAQALHSIGNTVEARKLIVEARTRYRHLNAFINEVIEIGRASKAT